MKVIRKEPGKGPKVVDIQSVEDIYAELGKKVKKLEYTIDIAIMYDSEWRENGKPINTVICGAEFGGTVFLVGRTEDGFADTPYIDCILYALFSSARYQLIDRDNNVWQCRHCVYMQQFEADGPFENGWNVCPGCGGLLVTPKLQEVTE